MDFLEIKSPAGRRKIAFLQSDLQKKNSCKGLFWMGGFKSDMNGSKAQAVTRIGQDLGLGVTRFDYSGHGSSSGQFLDGTISDWLADSLAVFEKCETGQIIIGSSMGAWLAMLLNREMQKTDPKKVLGLILIAPAIDMTRDLMRDRFSETELAALETKGRVVQPSDYDEPYILTKKLIDDGENHLLFNKPIETGCPVHILQGGQDKAVPPAHALKLVSHLMQDPTGLTMVPDADHSLSRPQDIALLKRTIVQMLAGLE